MEGIPSIHTAILDWFSLWFRQRKRGEQIDWFLRTDSPIIRLDFLRVLFCAWGVAGVAFLVGTLVLTGPMWLMFGARVAQIVAIPGWAACAFCLAGAPYASYRRFYASHAKRRANKHGLDDPVVRRYMLRSIPRNDSIVWQSAVAAIVIWQYVVGL